MMIIKRDPERVKLANAEISQTLMDTKESPETVTVMVMRKYFPFPK